MPRKNRPLGRRGGGRSPRLAQGPGMNVERFLGSLKDELKANANADDAKDARTGSLSVVYGKRGH